MKTDILKEAVHSSK